MSASTQTFTKEAVAKLDIIPLFNALMKESTNKDSVYIKMKDTLQSIFDDGNLTEREKSDIIAKTISSATSSITNTSMQMAFTLAKEIRDAPYTLAKLVADTKLTQEQADKLASETDLVEEQLENMEADTDLKRINGWKAQAEIFTRHGIDVTAQNIEIPVLTSVFQSNPLALDIVQGEQAKAAKFSALASTFRRDGAYTWGIDVNKDIVVGSNSTPAAWDTLTGAQTDVAIRQEKGFNDNMRQHAANSSANMIGLLIASENYEAISQVDVDKWRAEVDE